MKESVKPYDKEGSKKEQVAKMFNAIAPRYDLLNRLLSFGIDKIWRKRLVKAVHAQQPNHIVDLATGTGDVAMALTKIPGVQITGLDIAKDMLALAKRKSRHRNLQDRIEWIHGDGEHLPFDDSTYDSATIAFGIRNYEDLEKGLGEMLRILTPMGKVYILEFSKPSGGLFKQLFRFYFKYILPGIGRLISRDPSAYTYLPESVDAFPDGEDFLSIMQSVGFTATTARPLTFGVATLYIGQKTV